MIFKSGKVFNVCHVISLMRWKKRLNKNALVKRSILNVSSSVIVLCLVITFSSSAQQLVLLKKNKVRGRFNPGDDIRYSLSLKGHLRSEVIKSITDTSFVTPTDTIMLYEVRRVDRRATYDFTRSLGIKMMTAGFLLQLSDIANVTLVQDEHYSFSPATSITAGGMIVIGFLLHRVRSPYITISRSAALVSVKKRSSLLRDN